jgi:hypothetical protein
MITKTTTPSWHDKLKFLFGGNPIEVWEFNVDGLPCKIVNEWRYGAKLLVDGVVRSQNSKMFEVAGQKPFLLAEVPTTSGKTRKIEIFLKAVANVKVRVAIDGVFLTDDYV